MRTVSIAILIAASLLAPARLMAGADPASKGSSSPSAEPGRLVLFIGVDISGSFMNGRYFDDSLEFLSRYIHAHLHGLGGMESPHSMFVGSIGGMNKGEAKTLFPIQMFQDRSVDEIEAQLRVLVQHGPERLDGGIYAGGFHDPTVRSLARRD